MVDSEFSRSSCRSFRPLIDLGILKKFSRNYISIVYFVFLKSLVYLLSLNVTIYNIDP